MWELVYVLFWDITALIKMDAHCKQANIPAQELSAGTIRPFPEEQELLVAEMKSFLRFQLPPAVDDTAFFYL